MDMVRPRSIIRAHGDAMLVCIVLKAIEKEPAIRLVTPEYWLTIKAMLAGVLFKQFKKIAAPVSYRSGY